MFYNVTPEIRRVKGWNSAIFFLHFKTIKEKKFKPIVREVFQHKCFRLLLFFYFLRYVMIFLFVFTIIVAVAVFIVEPNVWPIFSIDEMLYFNTCINIQLCSHTLAIAHTSMYVSCQTIWNSITIAYLFSLFPFCVCAF